MISNLNNNIKDGVIVKFTDDAEQFQFLISCIRHTTNGRIDFVEVARELNIVSREAAQKRYHRMMQKNGIMTAQGGGTRGPWSRKQKQVQEKSATTQDNASSSTYPLPTAYNPSYFLNNWENAMLNPDNDITASTTNMPITKFSSFTEGFVPYTSPCKPSKSQNFAPKVRVKKAKVLKPGQVPRKRGRPRKYPRPEDVAAGLVTVKTEPGHVQLPEGFVLPKEEDDDETVFFGSGGTASMAPLYMPQPEVGNNDATGIVPLYAHRDVQHAETAGIVPLLLQHEEATGTIPPVHMTPTVYSEMVPSVVGIPPGDRERAASPMAINFPRDYEIRPSVALTPPEDQDVALPMVIPLLEDQTAIPPAVESLPIDPRIILSQTSGYAGDPEMNDTLVCTGLEMASTVDGRCGLP